MDGMDGTNPISPKCPLPFVSSSFQTSSSSVNRSTTIVACGPGWYSRWANGRRSNCAHDAKDKQGGGCQ